jgi:hypothetical protein
VFHIAREAIDSLQLVSKSIASSSPAAPTNRIKHLRGRKLRRVRFENANFGRGV